VESVDLHGDRPGELRRASDVLIGGADVMPGMSAICANGDRPVAGCR